MPKEVMTRQAADNVYLHKDFHGALSRGIDYLHQQFGAEAVREYLWQFATAYYAPLKEDLRRRGLVAIQEHLERVYRTEAGRGGGLPRRHAPAGPELPGGGTVS
jgi:hypothetical protein